MVVIGSLIAACGSSGGGGDAGWRGDGGDGGDGSADGETRPAVAIDRLPTELGAAFCAKLYQCCGDNEIRQLLGTLGQRIKMSNCSALMPILLTSPVAELVYALTEEHIAYRGDQVPACLDSFRARSCPDFARTLAANTVPFSPQPLPTVNLAIFECPTMIEPRQMPGQLCEADYECIASDCRGAASGDRRCLARSRVNEACGPALDCEKDLVCLTQAGAGVCRRPGGNGEPCLVESLRAYCQPGLHCTAVSGQPTCRSNLEDGASCTLASGEECKSGRCEMLPGGSDGGLVDGGGSSRCGVSMPPPPVVLRCSGR